MSTTQDTPRVTRQDLIDGLRALADAYEYESERNLPTPYISEPAHVLGLHISDTAHFIELATEEPDRGTDTHTVRVVDDITYLQIVRRFGPIAIWFQITTAQLLHHDGALPDRLFELFPLPHQRAA